MKYLFYFGHPAQYLFLRATIKELEKDPKNKILITIKSKDVLESLLIQDKLPYLNIQKKERKFSKSSILLSLINRFIKLLSLSLKFKPDLMIGTDATIAIVGFTLRRNRITITEDDLSVINTLGQLTYPFTKHILCPSVCDVGKWGSKKIGYSGYMKLAYLHPEIFKKDSDFPSKYNIQSKYAIIRLSKLNAYHDFGIKGINEISLKNIIKIINNKGINVFISTERQVNEDFKKYIISIDPSDMHQLLANSQMLLCDSQSMSVEAAMLGIPSIRISDFAGRISVLEELERKYNLTFGIKPENSEAVYEKLELLLSDQKLNETFQSRKLIMLKDKINVTKFLVWFLNNYPESIEQLRINPKLEQKFISN